ncbi:hypothetical protein [Pseudomonas putida]
MTAKQVAKPGHTPGQEKSAAIKPVYGGIVTLDGNIGAEGHVVLNDMRFVEEADARVDVYRDPDAGDWDFNLIFPARVGTYDFATGLAQGYLKHHTESVRLLFSSGTLHVKAYDVAGNLHAELINVGAATDPGFLIAQGYVDFKEPAWRGGSRDDA